MTIDSAERSEISWHEVKIYLALRENKNRWLTHAEIQSIVGVARRTVRHHTLRFRKLGIIDVAEVFPAHRYRWPDKGERRNEAYVLRLDKAADVFGLSRGQGSDRSPP